MSLFNELKRRNVFRVGIAYIVVAWLLAQVADLAFENFGTPDWAIKTLLFVLLLGFPLALLFAWAFEMTPEGLKKEKDVDRSQSITPQTGRKLDFVIIGILAVALAYFAFDKFVLSSRNTVEVKAPEAVVTEAVEDAPAEPDRSIAVLPFVDMSPDKDQEYFSDGISEEILNSLARVRELKVAGRTSSFSFKGKNEDLRAIGEALGVAHILEGSIRKAGNTLRITAQLVKVDDGFHLWSDTYDRELNDVFAIQDEIASSILEQMKLHLIGGEAPVQLASTRADVEAYNLYLAAKQNIYKRDKASLQLASNLLERAITIDAKYAPAYAQRGIAIILLSDQNYGEIPEDEAYELAKPLLDKSVELDPNLAEGWAGLGLYYQDNGNQFQESIEMLEKALAINPGLINASNWLQTALAFTGNLAKSGEIAEQILERDPLYRPAINNVGFFYIRTGQLDKLNALIDRVKLYMPGDSMVRNLDIMYQRDSGNYAQSAQLAEAAWQQDIDEGENSRAASFQYSIALASTGQVERLAEVGMPGFQVWALYQLGRKEESRQLARKRAVEEEDFSSQMGIYMVERQYQSLVDLVETRWVDLDAFEADEPQRVGFGSDDLLDIAYAYQQIGNEQKFNEVLVRARESHEQQLTNGARNAGIYVSMCYQSLLEGDEEQALSYIERAHEYGLTYWKRPDDRTPAFAALNGVPRYEELLEQMLAHVNSERAKLELEPLEQDTYL
jgi:TolB-like protein/Tfp pilus assembly protein PilF